MLFAVILLMVAVVATVVYSSRPDPAVAIAPAPARAAPQVDQQVIEAAGDPFTGAQPTGEESAACTDEQRSRYQLAVQTEQERLAPYSISRSTLATYETLRESDLASLAEQGDSEAMVMLGARSMARAFGYDPAGAMELVVIPSDQSRLRYLARPDREARLEHANRAAGWFYRAAMHGRLWALWYYGYAYQESGFTVVDIELMSRADYEALDGQDQVKLETTGLFSMVMYSLDPDILDLSRMRQERFESRLSEMEARFGPLMNSLRIEFDLSLEVNGLYRADVPESEFPFDLRPVPREPGRVYDDDPPREC